tara:strand:- start:1143 stop:1631 length:489 start_codon:yes stop_codon:yes gene_type:complete
MSSKQNNHDDNLERFHHITDKRNIPVSLEIKELLFIDDHVTLLISEHDYEHMTTLTPRLPSMVIPMDIGFIETIGTGLLQAFLNPGKDVEVLFSQADLMGIREIAVTPVSYGNTNVGLSLKRKLYTALYGADMQMKESIDTLLDGIDVDFGEATDEPTMGTN